MPANIRVFTSSTSLDSFAVKDVEGKIRCTGPNSQIWTTAASIFPDELTAKYDSTDTRSHSRSVGR
jgi:hypothetical protein